MENTSLPNTSRQSGIVLFIVGAIFILTVSFLFVRSIYFRPLENLAQPTRITVEPGSSFASILASLEDSAVVTNPQVLRLMARVTGAAASIQAGEYELQPGISSAGLLALLVEGNTVQYRVTLIEGWNLQQVLDALSREESIEQTLFDISSSELAQLLGTDYSSAEGLIHPETYFYSRGTSDIDILRRARNRQQEILDNAWENRLGALPYDDPYDALIMASIIEKESGVSSEKGHIAGVFVRRLEQGMRLQSDPTIIYGLGDRYTGDITREHIREETAYNTYRINGLPPTPIAMAGTDSLLASLNPIESDYLYFVADGSGGHQFSATLEEHNAAVDLYQRSLTEELSN